MKKEKITSKIGKREEKWERFVVLVVKRICRLFAKKKKTEIFIYLLSICLTFCGKERGTPFFHLTSRFAENLREAPSCLPEPTHVEHQDHR
jgi:hypothetical protein